MPASWLVPSATKTTLVCGFAAVPHSVKRHWYAPSRAAGAGEPPAPAMVQAAASANASSTIIPQFFRTMAPVYQCYSRSIDVAHMVPSVSYRLAGSGGTSGPVTLTRSPVRKPSVCAAMSAVFTA